MCAYQRVSFFISRKVIVHFSKAGPTISSCSTSMMQNNSLIWWEIICTVQNLKGKEEEKTQKKNGTSARIDYINQILN